jgi:hypothetical protein
MLVSAGGFAIYRKETHLYSIVAPRFGNLKTARSKRRFENEWPHSKFGNLPGLDVGPIIRDALRECTDVSDFLRLVMEGVARAQHADRWLEATPTHVLYMEEIKRAFPDAWIVHVIRDGRDTALSIHKQQWVAPFPWDRHRELAVAALYWEWMVRSGMDSGRMFAPDYLEVRFESLVGDPAGTLKTIGKFIDHDLDYDRIQRTAMGTVVKPNTSFNEELIQGHFAPIGRWKTECSPDDIRSCEQVMGSFLEELGYPLASSSAGSYGPGTLATRSLYMSYFGAKQWLKSPYATRQVHGAHRYVDDPANSRRSPGRGIGRRRPLMSAACRSRPLSLEMKI